MKTLFLTALALFAAQVLAGPLYYTEKAGLSSEKKTIKSIEISHPVGAADVMITVQADKNSSCRISSAVDSLTGAGGKDRTSKAYSLYQALVTAQQASKNADGTYTVFVCEKGYMNEVVSVKLITYTEQK